MKPTVKEVVPFFVFLCQVIYFSDAVEVVTPVGKIIGSDQLRTRHGKVIYSFTGIPYAQPPVGDLRFKEPVPAKPWGTPFEATKNGPTCPQTKYSKLLHEGIFEFFGEEDCLVLNVYSPKVNSSAKLPVMFFIHGGSYTGGSGALEPQFLLDRNIVLVGLNYRLGALGFLATDDGVVPANLGMKDQVLALKWVHDNIENFGGDPKLITVIGHSAGGTSASFHLYSPLSKSLVRGGISMSGTKSVYWARIPMQLAHERTKAVATLCGCPSEPSDKLLGCMKKVPVEVIIEMQGKFLDKTLSPDIIFAPVFETNSSNAFLTSEANEADSEIPWLAGITSSDGLDTASKLLSAVEKDEFGLIKRHLDYFLPRALLLNAMPGVDFMSPVFQKIKQFYLGEESVEKKNIQNVVNMFTDAHYLSRFVGKATASKHRGDTYLYYYDYLSSVSFSTVFGTGNVEGVAHGDDLLNIFPMSTSFPNKTWSEKELEVSERMLDLFTNFAKFGSPTVNTSIKWEPIEKNGKTNKNKYLHISEDGFIQKENLLPERVAFWDSLI